MSNQLALLHIHLACHYFAPLNYPPNNITYGTWTTSNALGTLNLYLACKSLVPLNRSCINITDVEPTTPQKFPAKLATELPQGYTVFPDIGIAYKFHRNRKTWDEAKEHCSEEGGNLAVIDSFQKAEYVMDLKGSTTAPDIHVGIHRLSPDDEWVGVVTGSPPASIPWLRTDEISDITRKCVVILFRGGGLVASHCTAFYNYVCEITMFKN